ncbi:hypothetical protein B0H14DRAFT_3567952 [Mycena olivaceomarginata]|nr:hypothetical protein B0H14DRAFT_3567952 [Mycena olivaceomarginata]
MFNKGSGHHIHGGIFYNVGGNVNLRGLQTYHRLNGHSSHVAFQSQPESTWGLESERSPQQPTIQDHLHEGGHYGQPAGSQREWEEALRSEHRGSQDLTQRARPSSTSSGDLLGPFPADLRLPSTSSLEPLQSDPMMQHIHGGTFFTTANVNFFGTKKHHLEETTRPVRKRQRLEKRYGIKIFRSKNINLIHEIRSGPGYFLHTGQNKGRAVIFKIFNPGPTAQQVNEPLGQRGSICCIYNWSKRLESTVEISKALMHPNVLRIKGIFSPASLIHFIAYEDARWKNAEVPLAEALKTDLPRSKALGYKMDFHTFLDFGNQFLISINSPQSEVGDNAESQEPEAAWNVFNALFQKTLMSANYMFHRTVAFINCPAGILFTYVPADGEIKRDPVIFEDDSYPLAFGSMWTPKKIPEEELPAALRREYVWRNMDRGHESLAAIACKINQDLDMNISRLHRLTPSNG